MPPAATPPAPNPTAPRATGAATTAAAAPPIFPLFLSRNFAASSQTVFSSFLSEYQESFLFSDFFASAKKFRNTGCKH